MCTYARLMPVLNLAFRSLPSAESLSRNCGFALHAFLCKCFVLHDYCFRCSVFFAAVVAALLLPPATGMWSFWFRILPAA